jgi:hypothetical protein|tara:strand:+ start:39 stop:272 length:234 start_codon:yes stop_codon:yes gene_type:complete
MDIRRLRYVHFVGFRNGDEYWSAVKVWGRPDFIHLHHDYRMYGDTGFPIDPSIEVVIFGSKGNITPCKFSDQDHERW